MEQDRGFWLLTQRLSSLSSQALSHLAKQDPNLISKTGGTTEMFSTLGSYPVSQSHFDGSHGFFHESSDSQQQILSTHNPCIKDSPLAILLRNQVDGVISKPEGECTKKRLLVFDQSVDQTTLLLTSDIRKFYESLKQPYMKEELRRSDKDLFVCQGMQRNSEPDLQSEMKEDTEELNALLYSEDDSDYCSEENEFTSSGHGDQETFVESYGQSHSKKRKVLESYDSVTPSFLKTSMLDVESSCGSCGNTGIEFLKCCKPSSNKIGEEKIFETVSLLRSIVPGEELVDPILVIDKAIDYLKSLKMEAENGGHGSLCLQDT